MDMTNKGPLLDLFLDQLRYIRLVHHVQGRVRLKASWNGAGKWLAAGGTIPDAEEIKQLAYQIPGIKGCRVNLKALSIVIEYDESIWPYRLWHNLTRADQDPAVRETLRKELLTIWQMHGAQTHTAYPHSQTT
ncbi:MAG: hypothetical protein HQQ73_11335 [Desulfobulbaceae bacterium]|nr:hypothetical protein [Desulfobulbaceae bacterium]